MGGGCLRAELFVLIPMRASSELLGMRPVVNLDSFGSNNKAEAAEGERTEHLHIFLKNVCNYPEIFECLPCIAQLVPDKGLGLLSATITQIINKSISLTVPSSS